MPWCGYEWRLYGSMTLTIDCSSVPINQKLSPEFSTSVLVLSIRQHKCTNFESHSMFIQPSILDCYTSNIDDPTVASKKISAI